MYTWNILQIYNDFTAADHISTAVRQFDDAPLAPRIAW